MELAASSQDSESCGGESVSRCVYVGGIGPPGGPAHLPPPLPLWDSHMGQLMQRAEQVRPKSSVS